MSGLTARQISAPVLGQIEFAVDEGMAQFGDVGKEDADLTVFDLSRGPAILPPDTRRVAAAFGEAAFVDDHNRIQWLGISASGNQRRRKEGLAHQGAQFIAAAVLVPDGPREQALYAVRSGLPGIFGNLPAIFSGNFAEDGLQVHQRVRTHFRACKIRQEALMELEQAHGPAANSSQGWHDWRGCGRVLLLHAFLVSDGQLEQEGLLLLACHIHARLARSFC